MNYIYVPNLNKNRNRIFSPIGILVRRIYYYYWLFMVTIFCERSHYNIRVTERYNIIILINFKYDILYFIPKFLIIINVIYARVTKTHFQSTLCPDLPNSKNHLIFYLYDVLITYTYLRRILITIFFKCPIKYIIVLLWQNIINN